MGNEYEFKRAEDNARLITKLSVFAGIGSLIMLVVTLVLSSGRGGDTAQVAVIPFAFVLLFSAAVFVYGLLATAAAREDEEKELLSKRAESRALNVEEDVRFTAGRSFSNYCRFAPFALAVISILMMGGMLWNIYASWKGREEEIAELSGSPIHTALIAAVLMMVCVFAGAFYVGQSRQAGFRWLRSIGAWMIAGFASLLLVAVATVCYGNNLVKVDGVCAMVMFWVYVVLGAEFAVNFVVEFYRPRTLAEPKPVFESQLLSLFTEPGGVMRNIASALDYQFGFKVSGTWLYGFVERSFFPVVIIWAMILWGFTSLHEVGANQFGVRETFGKRQDGLLSSGIYWSLPYPFGTIRRFSCDELKRVYVGESAKGADERSAAAVVLWTNQHGGAEEPFIVAVPRAQVSGAEEADGKASAGVQGNGNASISFVNMAVPIDYRIRKDENGVFNYGYRNANPEKILKMIGEQAVTEYLAGLTMDALMSHGRIRAERELARRIQELADQNSLGIEIVRVGIMDAHPPVEKVAPAYQEVVGARQKRQTEVLKAQALRERVIPEAEAAATEIVAGAERYRRRIIQVSQAEKERFEQQLRVYNVLPRMFLLNSQLEMLEESCKDIRKYIVSSEVGSEGEVFNLNFETRDRLDLVNLDVVNGNEQK